MSDEKKKPNPTVVMVYLGRCRATGGKCGYHYCILKKPEHVASTGYTGELGDDAKVYSKPVGRLLQTGAVVEVEYDPSKEPGASIFLNTGKWLGTWHDEDRVVEWDAQSIAVRRQHEAVLKVNNANKRKPALERLEPFRDAYRKLNGPQRAQMLASVVEYIAKGSF